jgi:SAM-dependent methyltransferase
VSDSYLPEDAAFYDAEYADMAMLAEDVPFFLEHLPGGPLDILEVGVGTGRVARQLLAAGHRVVGVDSSPAMLRLANEAGTDCELIEADAAGDLVAAVGGRTFDRVGVFFNTFLALHEPEQQEAFLTAAAKLLRPSGRLWLDMFNPNLELILAGTEEAEELDPKLFRAADGRSVMQTTSVQSDLIRQVQHVRYEYQWFEGDELHTSERAFELAWIMPRELIRLLRLAGLGPTALWGGHDGSMLTATSDRIICEAGLSSAP